MKIEANGDLGTGNSFTEIIIENVGTIHIDKQITVSGSQHGEKSRATEHNKVASRMDKEIVRQEILRYVCQTFPLVVNLKINEYHDLWVDILALPEVDAIIYERGRQENTIFNRKEVCHIIHYIGSDAKNCLGLFETYNASYIANTIDEKAAKSIRPELGFKPSPSIVAAINDLVKTDKYQIILRKSTNGESRS